MLMSADRLKEVQSCIYCIGTRACSYCSGSGEIHLGGETHEDAEYAKCAECNGSGYCQVCSSKEKRVSALPREEKKGEK